VTMAQDLAVRKDGWVSILSALNRSVTRVERLMVACSAAGILAMMVILVVDVFGRYFFHKPLTWSYDIISIYLMPLLIFFALSDAFRKNQHISVDLLYANLAPTTQRALRLLAAILTAAVILPIAWLAFGQAVDRYVNDIVISGSILWPTWVPSLMLGLGTLLLIVRAVLDAVALVSALLSGSSDIPGESEARHESATAHVGGAT